MPVKIIDERRDELFLIHLRVFFKRVVASNALSTASTMMVIERLIDRLIEWLGGYVNALSIVWPV